MDCYVQPFARGSSFKLQITFDYVWIGRDKNFTDIAIPKAHCLLVSLRIRADDQRFALMTDEEQVKGPLRPENACFGLTSVGRRQDEEQVKGPLRPENACFGLTSVGRRLARPISVDSNRQRFIPFSVSQVGNLQISRRVPGL